MKAAGVRARMANRLARPGALALLLLVAIAGFGTGAGVRLTAALLADRESVPATFTTAATFPGFIAFVKVVGSASCGTGSDVVTVPAGGVAAGHTLVLTVVIRGNRTGAVSASDSRGNTYSVDATAVRTNQGRTLLMSAHVATALHPGDTITVTRADDSAEGVIVAEFSGIAATSRIDQTGTGNGNNAAPTVSIATAAGPRLIVGVVGAHDNVATTEAGGWTTLQTLSQQCGMGNPMRAAHRAAYRIEANAGTFTYNPTLAQNKNWYEAVVAYR